MSDSELLYEIRSLKSKLYGENGFKGDVPYIIEKLDSLDKAGDEREKRITVIETRCEEREKNEENSKVTKLKITGKYSGIVMLIMYIIYNIGVHLRWWA